MNLKLFTRRLLSLSAGIAFTAGFVVDHNAVSESHSIVYSLFKSIDNAKTLTYTMVYSERLSTGKIHVDSNDVKYQKSPLSVYIKTSDKTEILWPADDNADLAWVHTGSFPFLTIKLVPDGY